MSGALIARPPIGGGGGGRWGDGWPAAAARVERRVGAGTDAEEDLLERDGPPAEPADADAAASAMASRTVANSWSSPVMTQPRPSGRIWAPVLYTVVSVASTSAWSPSNSTATPSPSPRSESSDPGGGHDAAVQDHGGVADALDLLEQVRRQQHGDAELVADAVDQLQHGVALHRVEAVGGLVEQHQLRVVGEGLGELHPLALAGGHGAERPAALLAQPDLPQHVRCPVGGLAVGEAVDLGDVADEVDRLHVGREQVVLGGVAEQRPDLGAGGGRVDAEHPDLALVGLVEPEDQPEQAGLAGAVGAEQAR